MNEKSTPTLIAEAMWSSGIAQDRNNPRSHKDFTSNAVTVLNRRYVIKDINGHPIEQPDQIFPRVSNNLAQADALYIHEPSDPNQLTEAQRQAIQEAQKEFFNTMDWHLFLPNSPTLMNAGGRLQQLSACFVLPVEDSLEEIFEGVKQTALIHKSGGGTGFSFSRLRPKGDPVGSTGGVASGPVGFIRAYDVATDVVKQGGTRRGANMAVLRVDHPDITEFIHVKDTSEHLQNFNISVAVTDKFLDAVETNSTYDLVNPRTNQVTSTIPAKEIWDQILSSAHLTGDPGLIFIDNINRHNVNPHLGPIEAVNPCVTGDTILYTGKGLRTVEDLWNQRVDPTVVVDGRSGQDRFQQASPIIATAVKQVYRLSTDEGYQLRLTADHQVMTDRGWTPADQLQQGDKIHILNRKGGFGDQGSHTTGTFMAWLTAVNTLTPNEAPLPFIANLKLHDQFSQATRAAFRGSSPQGQAAVALATKDHLTSNQLYKHLIDLAAMNGLTSENADTVPHCVLQGTEPMQRGYLQALFSADSTTDYQDKSMTLTVENAAKAAHIQQLLLNFNIVSKTKPSTQNGPQNNQHNVVISGRAIKIFAYQLGLLNEYHDRTLKEFSNKAGLAKHPYEFKATFNCLEPQGEEQVYDLSEPVTNSFIANGLVVHNCGEQVLRPNEACNLGSINLARMVSYNPHTRQAEINWDLLSETCATAVHMMDNVIDMNRYPSDIIDDTTRSTRRIGIGVMGFADLLIQLGIPYNSEQARQLAREVMSRIQTHVHEASTHLAESRNPYPLWEGSTYSEPGQPKPMRNTAPVTIAPTGTISIIAGASSGIEPLFALCFTRNIMDGTKLTELNPYFEAAAKHHGFHSQELMDHVALTGSIQDADVPQWAKDVFKVASDITAEDHVKMQAAFQEYTDNAVSKTINFPGTATTEDIDRAYRLAYKLGCKGITVYRDGSKDNQVLSTGQTARPTGRPTGQENGLAHHPTTRERPRIMTGYTERYRTGHGNLYVTVNLDDSRPFEMFARVGKAGGCDSAQQEAICRLISMALRANIDPQEIINNLRGITCCPHWDDGKQIMSVPDALAQCLITYVDQPDSLAKDKEAMVRQLTLAHATAGNTSPEPDLIQNRSGPKCPDCRSALIFSEGCHYCSNMECGWYECG